MGWVGWLDGWTSESTCTIPTVLIKSLMNFSPLQTTVHWTRASWIWSRAVLYSSPWLGLVPLLICFVYRPLSFAPVVAEPWLTGGLPQEFPRVIQISLEFLSYFFGISFIFLRNFSIFLTTQNSVGSSFKEAIYQIISAPISPSIQ